MRTLVLNQYPRITRCAGAQFWPYLIYPQFYFLYVMNRRNCLGKGVFRSTSKIFLSAFPAELLWEEVSYHG